MTEEHTLISRVPAFAPSGKAWRIYRPLHLPRVTRAQALLARRLQWILPAAGASGQVTEEIGSNLKALFEADVHLAVNYVHVAPAERVQEYLENPTCVASLAAAPHKARGLFEVDLKFAHSLIDLLLGGGGESSVLRPLTEIEEGVVSYVILEILKALASQMGPGVQQLRLERLLKVKEAAAVLADETDNWVVVQFGVRIGRQAGLVRIYLHSSLIGLSIPARDSEERRARRILHTQKHLTRLAGVKTWLRAEIGSTGISLRDLGELTSGDVVLMDELTARPDLGQGGTARLRVGLGRVGRMHADIILSEGHFQAKVTGFEFGEEPRQTREPSDQEEAAAEALSDQEFSEDGFEEEREMPQETTDPSASGQEEEGFPVDEKIRSEGIELLDDIPLQISVELSRIPITAEEVVGLQVGEVLDLNRVPGEPVDLSVNGKVVGRGELVEVEGHLGVRILSLAG